MSKTSAVKITLNGKPSEIQSGMAVTDLLTKWKIRPELVTVEINGNILQKLDYETAEIKHGDVINFVFYMGGGSWEKHWALAAGDAVGESSSARSSNVSYERARKSPDGGRTRR